MSAALPIIGQDDTEALVQMFNSVDGGPSPHGLSNKRDAIECGRRGVLKAAERAAGGARPPLKPRPDGKLWYLRVGLFVHKLFEGRILRQLGVDLTWDARASAFDQDFLEAIRLFRGYHQHWGSIEERWGCRVLGAEILLGEGEQEARVREKLGGPLTGRADAIIEIVDPDKAFANTGHRVMPGRYVFDYKCSEKHGSKDATKFGPDNLQAQAYLYLDTLQHGEGGAIGVIFERLIGHQELRKEAVGKNGASYASFVVYPQMDSEETLRGIVELADIAMKNNKANRFACENSYGDICWFKQSGQCPGW